MLVCHCLRVFDGAIRECVRTGARSPAEISERCGAGGACGGCRESIEKIVEQESSSRSHVPESRLRGCLGDERIAA
jgi:bacterioferritin-associated ferredoxin